MSSSIGTLVRTDLQNIFSISRRIDVSGV